ncbi:MAG: cysteine desulfurase [Candidatus Nanopelagicales bacterium]|nr:cysteine desulfurase [Candidatus Nanopelagicales bacterium]MDP4714467.1 cysteine desulfurase [Candidatus Nanopelagicales bacterium]MDP4905913.1 cysteine desulfurase [Candidatus Nanopelagicales bacterium]MDP4975528.1 cysteine desulfurase [Candidatus Nanopelagicales bacterium]
MSTDRAYLDHAATTSVLPDAADVWRDVSLTVGNPSSLHASGRAARRVVEEARESLADDLGVRPSEVIFTSGGTEADNLAVKGLAWAAPSRRRRILCSTIEHHAVLDPVLWLGSHGYDIDWLPVDDVGRVDPHDVRSRLGDDVALCTVMWANNEVGTVQPLARIAEACAEAKVPFHSDAVQAIGRLAVDAGLPGLTSLAMSGHKLGAPVGTGALVLRRDADVVPLMHGGGQEREVRSGTLDAAGAASLAVAVRQSVADQEVHAARMNELSERLIEGIRGVAPDAVINGDPEHRLPGTVHVSFPGSDGDTLLMLFDAAGVECSTGSACTAGVPEPSHVLEAMGIDAGIARGSLRFSFGRSSRSGDVDLVIEVMPGALDRAFRAATPRLRPVR